MAKSKTFKIGDVVHLKSGDFKMTVEAVEGDQVRCVWREKDTNKRDNFPAPTLKKFTPARTITKVALVAVYPKLRTRDELTAICADLLPALEKLKARVAAGDEAMMSALSASQRLADLRAELGEEGENKLP